MLYRELIKARVLLSIMVEDALEVYLFNKSKAILALLYFLSSINLFKDAGCTAKEAELED